MPDSNERIERLARSFIDELKKIATDELMILLGNGSGRAVVSKSGSASAAPAKRKRGGKRAHADLEALQQKALAVITAQPGLRIEQLNNEIGAESGELALPIRKLLAAKQIETTGNRRSTRYHVASKTSPKGRKKKSKR